MISWNHFVPAFIRVEMRLQCESIDPYLLKVWMLYIVRLKNIKLFVIYFRMQKHAGWFRLVDYPPKFLKLYCELVNQAMGGWKDGRRCETVKLSTVVKMLVCFGNSSVLGKLRKLVRCSGFIAAALSEPEKSKRERMNYSSNHHFLHFVTKVDGKRRGWISKVTRLILWKQPKTDWVRSGCEKGWI